MAQIIFIKLGNGNVQILKEVNSNAQQPINEPIASLHPLQNIIRDNANPNNIIIKSAIGNNLDRGIVLDVNNINGGACVPIIENTNIDSLINSLAKDFFFDAGNEIVEVDSYFNFPAIGFSGKIYVAVDTLLMYRWNGSNYDLYARGTSVTNYENIMFSDKEFKKTFYAIFPTGVNKKVDLLFPNYLSLNIDADIEVAIQSYNLATGTLKKTFTIIKNALSDEFVRYQSNNSTVDNDYILNQFSIGEAKLVNDTQLSIPILKRVDTSSIYLKNRS
ncbi:hypothetical protein [Flavobacterium sp.]|uniref:hypothetical protein n=1 Tax=Flavobacterium sp. TaxID=239 RepID=UPI00374CCA36